MENTEKHLLDLMNPVHAYLFGMIQTDGHLSKNTRNRGKLQLEISYRDANVLEQLASVIPYKSSITTRTRSTNFSAKHTSAVLTVCAKEFRDEIVRLGMIYGKKSDIIDVPQ